MAADLSELMRQFEGLCDRKGALEEKLQALGIDREVERGRLSAEIKRIEADMQPVRAAIEQFGDRHQLPV